MHDRRQPHRKVGQPIMFPSSVYVLKYRHVAEGFSTDPAEWHTEYHATVAAALMAEQSLMAVDAASAHLFTVKSTLEIMIAEYRFAQNVTTTTAIA